VIEIEGLSKAFGPVKAVQELHLTVSPGEIFCLVGPNGAGKTTTVKLLCGLLKPDEGRIRICGYDIQKEPVAARRCMGYIPDQPFVYERLTATEFLHFVGALYRMERREVEKRRRHLFRLLGLEEYASHLVADLSHGFRQRLLYATILMHDPQVMVVDEPLVGLDPYSIRLIKDLLRRKASEGTTVFLTTHILPVAEEIAHRIGVLPACGGPPGRTAAAGRHACGFTGRRIPEVDRRPARSGGPAGGRVVTGSDP